MQFGHLLARFRRERGLSQEELAFRAGLSQRHISFLETGRSGPGARSLNSLVAALALRAWEHRALLDALAPAPMPPSQAPLNSALVHQLISRFSHWPAYAFQPDGTLLAANASMDRLLAQASPDRDLWQSTAPPAGPNIYDLLFHPAGLVQWLENPEEVVPETLRRLRVDVSQDPSLAPTLRRIEQLPSAQGWAGGAIPPAVLVERYRLNGELLSIISVLSHLASPGELALANVRIESFVPADTASERLLIR